jgi:cytochrome c oxidase assembly factor CtaG
MISVTQRVLLSWSVPPAASFALALTALVYLRGWLLMRRAGVPFIPAWRAACFIGGLLTIWLALASPLDTFASFLIAAHMSQHMLLMMIAPPLILLGAPLIPLVRGLPIFAAREFAGPFLNWQIAMRLGKALTKLWVAVMLMGMVMFAWHTPRLYELALSSSGWHEFEHVCFFLASLIFWWPVVQPWPSHAQSPRWAVVPYLLIADLQNTILSAILVFSDRLLYPSYSQMPRLFGLSALHDQAASGAIMWVVGSAAFLVPAVVIAVQCLSGRSRTVQNAITHPDPVTRSGMANIGFPRRMPLVQRFGEHRVQAITFVCLFALTGLTLATLASRASDDDQALIAKRTTGPLRLFVYAARELQPGINGFAALVQDLHSQDILPKASIDIRVEHAATPHNAGSVRAGTNESENKLLQSAEIDLPAGHSVLAIDVRNDESSAEFSLPVDVLAPETRLSVPWAYAVACLVAIVLIAAYFSRHRTAVVRPISAEKLPFTNKAM